MNSLKVYSILIGSLAIHRFPTFCAALVGGFTLLQRPLRTIYNCVFVARSSHVAPSKLLWGAMVPRFIAALISAWFSLQLLNTPRVKLDRPKSSSDGGDGMIDSPENAPEVHLPDGIAPDHVQASSFGLAGKTIDLTLLAVTRAIDTLIINAYRRSYTSYPMGNRSHLIQRAVSRYADSLLFALSSGTVMWAWFYLPDRLPRAYNKWIDEAAQVDGRLIYVLRKARAGDFVYGYVFMG